MGLWPPTRLSGVGASPSVAGVTGSAVCSGETYIVDDGKRFTLPQDLLHYETYFISTYFATSTDYDPDRHDPGEQDTSSTTPHWDPTPAPSGGATCQIWQVGRPTHRWGDDDHECSATKDEGHGTDVDPIVDEFDVPPHHNQLIPAMPPSDATRLATAISHGSGATCLIDGPPHPEPIARDLPSSGPT